MALSSYTLGLKINEMFPVNFGITEILEKLKENSRKFIQIFE